MAVEKLSISLDEEAVAAARAAAEAEGLSLSAWLSQAAVRTAALEDGRRAVREYEAEHGVIPDEERRLASVVLGDFGVGR